MILSTDNKLTPFCVECDAGLYLEELDKSRLI